MSFFADDTIDPAVDRMLKEVATRESYHLFGKVFEVLRQDVDKRLRKADPELHSLLQVQAYSKVISDLETRMRRHRGDLKKDRPITAGMK